MFLGQRGEINFHFDFSPGFEQMSKKQHISQSCGLRINGKEHQGYRLGESGHNASPEPESDPEAFNNK